MKRIRILSLLLALSLLLLPLGACGKRGTTLDDLKPTDELVVYLPQQIERDFTERYIVPYRVLYPDVRVKITVVPGDEDWTWKDYSEKVSNELLAGEGPDVLLFEYLPSLDIPKAALNHNFYDLTDILDSDPEFHAEDYLDGALDAVKVGGRLYSLPRACLTPYYVSDEEKLEDLGFDWGSIKKTSDFMDELVRLTPEAAERNEAFQQMMESKNRFSDLFRCSGIRLLDYEKNAVLPDEAQFRAFWESYQAFSAYDYDETAPYHSGNYRAPDLMQGTFYFWDVNEFYDLNWSTRDMMDAGHSVALCAVPGQDGKLSCQITSQLAVSAASKNVLNAYNFVKLMCSEEIMAQTFWETHQLPQSLSLRKPIYEVPVLKSVIGAVVRGKYPWSSNYHLTDEEEDEMVRQFTSYDRFTVKPNRAVYDMMWDAMLPYLQNKESFDDCLADLKTKLTFYISE